MKHFDVPGGMKQMFEFKFLSGELIGGWDEKPF